MGKSVDGKQGHESREVKLGKMFCRDPERSGAATTGRSSCLATRVDTETGGWRLRVDDGTRRLGDRAAQAMEVLDRTGEEKHCARPSIR